LRVVMVSLLLYHSIHLWYDYDKTSAYPPTTV
jgi:hypothetical protein